MIELLESSAFGAALVFGFRHGFDWDHLAALSDLTGSETEPRRSMWLATLYALGHACMVVVLGVVAILFAERIPDPVDVAMERVVGVTLVGLGLWIVWTAIRTGGAPPMRSRWMLVLDAVRRLRARRRGEQQVVIEHSHPHDHGHPMHEHAHADHELAEAVDPTDGAARPATAPAALHVGHVHTHRHVAPAPLDPFTTYRSGSAFGIGLLHGVGAETPTQVLLFAAAAQATDRPSSLGLLLCFVVGLVLANTLIAAATTLGFRSVLRNRAVSIGLASITAAFSLAVGTLLLAGRGASLPAIFAG